MNQHLQNILDAIQQDKHLPDAEKNAILKSLKDADKEFEITAFKLDRTEKVKRTTAILLEETIEELEQKRKAVEAQNRELEIETALERVRTVAMGMNKADELLSICEALFKELQKLGFSEIRNAMINIHNDEKESLINYDYSDFAGGVIAVVGYNIYHSVQTLVKQARSSKEAFIEYVYTGTELADWKAFRKKNGEYDDPRVENISALYYYFYSIGIGSIGISTFSAIGNERLELLKRFRNVFDLSYRRYVDITNAEEQAREAQIQLALERARTQSMLMQHSDELDDTLRVFHQQVLLLGIHSEFSFLWLPDEEKDRHIFWAVWEENDTYKSKAINYPLNRHEPATAQCLLDWKGKEPIVSYHVPPAGVENYFTAWQELLDDVEKLKPAYFSAGLNYVEAFMKYGCFGVMVAEDVNEIEKKLLARFAIEFERTYTRFLDLQKAEAQAREAQIEAALEKVRSRSLAMQKSEELKDVIQVVYEQFVHLNVNTEHTGFVIDYKTRDDRLIWVASKQGVPSQLTIPYFDSEYYNSFNEAKEKGWDFFATNLSFDDKNSFYRKLFTYIPGLPEESKEFYFTCPGLAISTVLLENIGLYIENFDGIPYSDEDNAILMRFGKVFQQTYTRFLDLQKAEAQARESQIEAALERVRSRTLAMQKSDELAETASVLFQQLITLGIEPNRLYIAIVKDDHGNAEFWITDEDGTKVSSAFETNLNDNPTFKKMLDGWRQQNKSLVIDMQGEELQDYFKYLTSIHVPFKGGLDQKRRLQDIAYFGKGFIGMASPEAQPAETLVLLERFAAVFNLTFTRFNDLKMAEAQTEQAVLDLIAIREARQKAEDALTELQATQKQLIQSEKMASLGELTAGIAHEIQNPLNFVNNFSEVSNELIDEMNEEIEKGDIEEAKAIANDIKQNLEKINHHGKRADAIVKGMLQHSRSSTSTKEPTDINKLADEYLKLAYHGLRAKDKTFNSSLKTEYDEGIGKINIIPQDIGRVILNLITNAFYVVNEKTLSAVATPAAVKYEPTVSISTKKLNGKVEIKVSDNGNGIPPKLLDKIFQPFFTTKPTGQGTGLGLSLAYDIVKAHGGELKVDTKEGEGTEFIIQLPVF